LKLAHSSQREFIYLKPARIHHCCLNLPPPPKHHMSEQSFTNIGEHLSEAEGTTSGQMFGKPCLKTSNKAFAAFFKGEMVFKLGKREVDLLKDKYTGAQNWDPSGKGRAMKDWLQVPAAYESDWQKLALQALKYMRETA